jgi:hypothetical protein
MVLPFRESVKPQASLGFYKKTEAMLFYIMKENRIEKSGKITA